MELLSGHEKIITKSRISLNAGTLNRGFTVYKSDTGHVLHHTVIFRGNVYFERNVIIVVK
jgi:hypothetical protein